ncbi:hypothetical protein NW762_012047 [Fusarium torreyae]|uniref:Uncharacterized protein n=1 Tax=Fusarium torreyae TaxID=1237075 RepID=A0A9W8RPZ8_9HYPO|nr:hypothetical protein NW762_012047 [Fusarium torreyae]
MQFATYEPAVRHAIVTISLLYEQLPSTPSRLGNLRAPIQLQHQQLILTHYNDAIKLVRSMTAADQLPLVLLLCILFVGIEMLQSNPRLAIQHFNMVFEPDEMEYDKYLGRFKRIQDILVSVASDMPTQTLTSGNSSSKFTMEMAWVPIVSFCTLKCRDLGIRLKMWNTLPILGTSRESLWELSLMIPILKHVIEMEHGLPQGQIDGLEDTGLTDLPPGSLRIKHMWIQSKLTRLMIGEQLRLGRFVGFLLPGDDGEVHSLTEFLDETEYIPG